MKAVELKIIIYKRGEDVDLGNTKKLMSEIAKVVKDAGFDAQIDMQSGSFNEVGEKE